MARPISKAIVNARRLMKINTTNHLARIVASVALRKNSKLHPATKVFLALRIEVNHEIENLKLGIENAIKLLKPNGRLAVISFHETEDRLVKQLVRKANRSGQLKIITKKPLTSSRSEREVNPRSRSAKLRIAEKI